MIKEQAKVYADSFGFDGFKASNGWLESFKRRHNIGQLKMCGESGAVDQSTVDDFTSKLPSICESYVADNIFNMDETEIFYCALPDKSLTVRGTDCHRGKHSKEQLTAVFLYKHDRRVHQDNGDREITKSSLLQKYEPFSPTCNMAA